MPSMMTSVNPESVSSARWLASAVIAARRAQGVLGHASAEIRNRALIASADLLRRHEVEILDANAHDLSRYRGASAFRDRLALDPARISAMADGLDAIAALPDPLNKILESWTRPNGLQISRISAPIGVIGVIYESRPNVGIDAAGLCVKSGNAVILRGGSDSFFSSAILHWIMQQALKSVGLPEHSVQSPPLADREVVTAMMESAGEIDLLIPRGGKALVERLQRESRVPILAHAEGICHTYVHSAAITEMAIEILANAKLRRPGICSATETLLLDAEIAEAVLPIIVERMKALGCGFRADAAARAILPLLPQATESDFSTEWQDAILSIAIVDGVEGAIRHVNKYGTAHTDAIVTGDAVAAHRFLAGVKSAVALWNASTQFSDGGEFGFGAEIGISTGRLHARGPVGADQLTTPRYIVIGSGQTRA
jgi:glutamate-5-semialdehyde dehydrogenase